MQIDWQKMKREQEAFATLKTRRWTGKTALMHLLALKRRDPMAEEPRGTLARFLDAIMHLLVGALLMLAAFLIFFANHPVVPAYEPVPATDARGVVWWVCPTKPRTYIDSAGTREEIDHYLQLSRCPKVPID